jgi:protein phosphatase
VLPPAEACRLLIELANMRGGPDNITVVLVRVGGPSPESNGVAAIRKRQSRPLWSVLPLWPFALLAGTLLAVLAIVLQFNQWPATAGFTFILGSAAIVAGLAGLILHYRRERQRITIEEEPSAPRIHRQTTCRIEQPLLDRLIRAVKTLHQFALEKHWAPDWKSYEEHVAAAELLMQQGGDPAAIFREHCRALMPLTRALHKQRHKEESFQPMWDKTQ